MSEKRISLFDKCQVEKKGERDTVGVDPFKYDAKMSPADACKVKNWLASRNVNTVNDLLTHQGMRTASDLMCRWPRPSELAMMANCMGGSTPVIRYHRMTIQLELKPSSSKIKKTLSQASALFVGALGINFSNLCADYNLMYMWLHPGGTLVVYAATKELLETARPGILKRAHDNGLKRQDDSEIIVRTLTLSVKAPDWVQPPRRLSAAARPFVPRRSAKRR